MLSDIQENLVNANTVSNVFSIDITSVNTNFGKAYKYWPSVGVRINEVLDRNSNDN